MPFNTFLANNNWYCDLNLKDFQVDDLLCSNSDVIFILESPHCQELKAGYPAAGDTGVNMSRALFNCEKPLGELIRNRSIYQTQLSILNCSLIPLQRKCYGGVQLSSELVDFFNIKSICYPSIKIKKNEIKKILHSDFGLQTLDSFKSRLYESIKASQKAKIVVCGVIAQCFFEETTKLHGVLRNATDITWKGFNISVFYEYHPSSKSGRWSDYSGMQALRNYVRQQVVQ